jgi:hypothetical protein
LNIFQNCLLTLALYIDGGQRKQVILFFNLNNFEFNDKQSKWFLKPGIEKTDRVSFADGIPFPNWFGEFYFLLIILS